jgi:hypothetical protein
MGSCPFCKPLREPCIGHDIAAGESLQRLCSVISGQVTSVQILPELGVGVGDEPTYDATETRRLLRF